MEIVVYIDVESLTYGVDEWNQNTKTTNNHKTFDNFEDLRNWLSQQINSKDIMHIYVVGLNNDFKGSLSRRWP